MEKRLWVLCIMVAMLPMRGEQRLQRVSELLSRSSSYVAKRKVLLIGLSAPAAALTLVALYARTRKTPIRQVLPTWLRTLSTFNHRTIVPTIRNAFVRGKGAIDWCVRKIVGFFPRGRRLDNQRVRGALQDPAIAPRLAGAIVMERPVVGDRVAQQPHPVIGDFHEEVPCDCGCGGLKVAVIPGDIHLVALGGHVDFLRECIAREVPVDFRNGCEQTPLMRAAHRNHVEAARYLLSQGADIEAKDRWEHTPLCWAVKGGHVDMTRFLLEAGANIHAYSFKGRPLDMARRNHNEALVQILQEAEGRLA